MKKRKLDEDTPIEPSKKLKMTTAVGTSSSTTSQANIEQTRPPTDFQTNSPPHEEQNPSATQTKKKGKGKEKERLDAQPSCPNSHRRIKKLKPPRPFPTVPTSVSATGPRSAHREGKNMICITRKTSLGAYMRRCKKVIIEDGYV